MGAPQSSPLLNMILHIWNLEHRPGATETSPELELVIDKGTTGRRGVFFALLWWLQIPLKRAFKAAFNLSIRQLIHIAIHTWRHCLNHWTTPLGSSPGDTNACCARRLGTAVGQQSLTDKEI